MINFSCYDIMSDNIEDFINKQGYTVHGWGKNFTDAIRYANVLEMWGFISSEEAQLIFNKVMIRVFMYAQPIEPLTKDINLGEKDESHGNIP